MSGNVENDYGIYHVRNKFQPLVKHEYNFLKRDVHLSVFRDGGQRWERG